MSEGSAFISVLALREGQLDNTHRQIQALLAYFELKEATSLFELALWKAMVKEHSAVSIEERDACRIGIPGPVKDAIMQFLPL